MSPWPHYSRLPLPCTISVLGRFISQMLGGKPEAILGSSLLFLLSSSPSASRSALLQCPTTSHHPYTAGTLAGALSAHLLCGNHLPTDLLLASSVGFPLSSQKEPLKLGRAHHTSAQSPLPAFYLTRKAKILTRALRPTQSTDIIPPSVQPHLPLRAPQTHQAPLASVSLHLQLTHCHDGLPFSNATFPGQLKV